MQLGDKVEITKGRNTGKLATIIGFWPGNQYEVRLEDSGREIVAGGGALKPAEKLADE